LGDSAHSQSLELLFWVFSLRGPTSTGREGECRKRERRRGKGREGQKRGVSISESGGGKMEKGGERAKGRGGERDGLCSSENSLKYAQAYRTNFSLHLALIS